MDPSSTPISTTTQISIPTHAPLDFSGYLPHLHLADGLDLPTYFVVVSLSLSLCVAWLARRAEVRGLSRNLALDVSLAVMIAGFVGSRLLHVIFEEPRYYLESPLRVFEFWQGGFVWYGGALAGTAAGLFVLRRRKEKLSAWLDLVAPIAALGYALGRVACLLTGCCFGAVCLLRSGFAFRWPTQGFAVAWELALFGALLMIEKNRRSARASRLTFLRREGALFYVWLVGHGVGRLIMEAFRDDDRGPALASLSVSTWISMVLVLLGLVLLFKPRRAR